MDYLQCDIRTLGSLTVHYLFIQVVLVEGDVLVVPRHWWHYVECTGSQPSVSVNTWVNLVGVCVWYL